MPKKRQVPYTDPVTGVTRMVDEDALIGQSDHSLKGAVKGAMDAETKAKISASVKAYIEVNPREQSEETKERIRQANIGKTVSEETRKKLSEKAKQQWARRKEKGYVVADETKSKISEATKGKPKSNAHKAKIAAAMRARKQRGGDE